MEKKTWKQRLENGEKAKDIVFSEPKMDLLSWHFQSKIKGLSASQEAYIIRCAERFNRTLKDYVSD
jgi:hypothetical protein